MEIIGPANVFFAHGARKHCRADNFHNFPDFQTMIWDPQPIPAQCLILSPPIKLKGSPP